MSKLFTTKIQLGEMRLQEQEFTKKIDVAKGTMEQAQMGQLDAGKFEQLLKKANGYVSEMEKFLEQAKQQQRDRYLELFDRNAILNANGSKSLILLGRSPETVLPQNSRLPHGEVETDQTHIRVVRFNTWFFNNCAI